MSVSGVSKLGWLNTLNASNWYLNWNRSLSLKFLNTEKLKFVWKGARKTLRPVVPNPVSCVSQTCVPLTVSQGGTPSAPGAMNGIEKSSGLTYGEFANFPLMKGFSFVPPPPLGPLFDSASFGVMPEA